MFFQPVPWRRISGSVNRRVLDRLAGAVLSHCMALPGANLADIQQHFHPMLTGFHIRLLVEVRVQVRLVVEVRVQVRLMVGVGASGPGSWSRWESRSGSWSRWEPAVGLMVGVGV